VYSSTTSKVITFTGSFILGLGDSGFSVLSRFRFSGGRLEFSEGLFAKKIFVI
jgi:hypothetical protein